MSVGQQLSLLDWAPAPAVVRFEEGAVRAQRLAGRICRAIGPAVAGWDCAVPRDQVAARMSSFLGAPIGVNALNAYASESRLDRMISLPRFVALLWATRDRRLLELVAEPFGWAVIDRKYLPLIEITQVRAKRRELARHQRALERVMQTGGAC